jgi:hypothetical protein
MVLRPDQDHAIPSPAECRRPRYSATNLEAHRDRDQDQRRYLVWLLVLPQVVAPPKLVGLVALDWLGHCYLHCSEANLALVHR